MLSSSASQAGPEQGTIPTTGTKRPQSANMGVGGRSGSNRVFPGIAPLRLVLRARLKIVVSPVRVRVSPSPTGMASMPRPGTPSGPVRVRVSPSPTAMASMPRPGTPSGLVRVRVSPSPSGRSTSNDSLRSAAPSTTSLRRYGQCGRPGPGGSFSGRSRRPNTSGVRNVVMSAIRVPRRVSTLTPCET